MSIKKPNLKTVWVDYISNFTPGLTQFIKTGLSHWFFPVDKKEILSSPCPVLPTDLVLKFIITIKMPSVGMDVPGKMSC